MPEDPSTWGMCPYTEAHCGTSTRDEGWESSEQDTRTQRGWEGAPGHQQSVREHLKSDFRPMTLKTQM